MNYKDYDCNRNVPNANNKTMASYILGSRINKLFLFLLNNPPFMRLQIRQRHTSGKVYENVLALPKLCKTTSVFRV